MSLLIDPISKQIAAEQNCWFRLKERCHRKSGLYHALEAVSKTDKIVSGWQKTVSQIIQGAGSSEYCYLKRFMRNIIKQITPEQLKELLTEAAKTSLKQGPKIIDNLLPLVSLDELNVFFKEQGCTLDEQILWHSNAKKKEVVVQQPKRPNFLVRVLDTMIIAFSFFKLGHTPGSSWEASHMIEVYGKMIVMPLVLFTALSVIFSPLTALIATAAIVSTIAFGVFIYIKRFKNAPKEVPYCINLTQAARENKLEEVLGRDEQIAQLARNITDTTQKVRFQSALIGDTRVGKTYTVYGLAQQIVDGKIPELKGKEIYLVKTPKLVPNSFTPDTTSKLQQLYDFIGDKNRKNVILFFDEFQAAFTGDGKLGEEFTNFLDTSLESFFYCILATTTKEFDDHIAKHPKIVGRVQKIPMESTDKANTLAILRSEVENATDLTFTNEELEKMYKEDVVQPNGAKIELAREMSRRRQSNLEELNKSRSRLKDLKVEFRLAEGKQLIKIGRAMDQLKKEIAEQKEIQRKERKKNKRIAKAKILKAEAKKELYEIAKRCGNDDNDMLKKRFAFQKEILIPYFSEKIAG